MVAVSDSSDRVATLSREVLGDAVDVDVESADGCLWVVIGLDVGDGELEATVRPADAEVLYRDLRGGVTLEKIERARIAAAIG